MTDQLLEKIKSRGYWKVIIRPERFKEDLIENFKKCDELIDDSTVHLRGWSYPHYSKDGTTSGLDYIERRGDWKAHIEIWRLYHSGQFVHFLGLREDWWNATGEPSVEPGKALSLLGTLYTITEIYLFASRLVEKLGLESPIFVYINLVNTRDRQIVTLDPRRELFDEYISQLEEIPREIITTPSNLIANSAELAIEHIMWLFERFNWKNQPKEVFMEEQKKFLEKRI